MKTNGYLSKAIAWLAILAGLVVVATSTGWSAAVCPFCSAINLTFAEQMKANDIVVIAKLFQVPKPVDDPNAELPKAEFEISQILKGKEYVEPGMKFRTLLVGTYPIGHEFLVMGVDPPNVAWSTPMKTSPRINEYLNKIQSLPPSGPDRLAFFQQYFEDEESVLAFDAYDEFATASYDDLKALKDRMDHDQLVEWIKDPKISVNRRRLYLTMLGVCGTEEDIKMLEEFIRSGDRKKQAGLDALIASYLTLKGADGLPLIEETFLKDKDAEYVDTLSAVSALRFHGTDANIIPRERIVQSVRLLLDRPRMADMIIPDLARWQDWSVMDRLVELFKNSDEETNWLRVPVITYLRACPKPEAKQYIEELRKIDPDAVARADFFLNFDSAGDDWDDDTLEDDTNDVDGGGDTPSETGGEDKGGEPQGNGDTGSGGLTAASPERARVVNLVSVPVSIQSTVEDEDPLEPAVGNVTDPKKKVEATGTPEPATDGDDSLPGLTEVPEAQSAKQQPVSMPVAPEQQTTTLAPTGPPANSMATPRENGSSPSPSAQTATPPVASASPLVSRSWQIILIPMFASAVLFVLFWSVFNGWFERLIY